jgi:hypothetical protein
MKKILAIALIFCLGLTAVTALAQTENEVVLENPLGEQDI